MVAITRSRRYGAIASHFPDGATCHLCGKPVAASTYGHALEFGEDTVTLDHITPQSHGGSDDEVRPAHLKCNSFRGAAPVAVARVLLTQGRPRVVAPDLRAAILADLALKDMDLDRLARVHGASERDIAEVIYVATQSSGWAASEREQAIAKLASGVRPRFVADQFGRGRKAVYKLAQAIKLTEHETITAEPYSDEDVSRAFAMRGEGKSIRQIADEIGRSYKSVERMFARKRAKEMTR